MARKSEPESPSLFSVLFGGLFAAFLGALLAAVNLAVTPVQRVKAMPPEEERTPGQVYLVMGEDSALPSWEAKRDRLLAGEGTTLEILAGELNGWSRRAFGSGIRDSEVPPALMGFLPEPTAPAFRLTDDERLQISSALAIPRFPNRELTYQATGQFESGSDGAPDFVPERIYIGSCPIPGIPGLRSLIHGFLANAFITTESYQELAPAWNRIRSASVKEGYIELRLTGP